MRGSRTLLQVLGVFCTSGAFAAELDLVELKSPQFVPATPSWSVVGSLSPTYTENALFSRDNRRHDFFFEPDVSIRLDGNLTHDLSYCLFARTQYEAFAREKVGNAAIARLGGRFTQNLFGWRITVITRTDMISTASTVTWLSLRTT